MNLVCLYLFSYSNLSIYGSSLDDQLQDALKEYLQSKGIGESLTNFLLYHLHKKEHGQYVNWLHILESHVAKPKPDSDRIQ